MRDKIGTETKPHLLCRKRLQEVHFGLREALTGAEAAGSTRGAHKKFSSSGDLISRSAQLLHALHRKDTTMSSKTG